ESRVAMVFVLCLCKGQAVQGLAGDAYDAPFGQDVGANVFVEVDGVLVPIQDGPFESAAVLFDGKLGQVLERHLAHALAAMLGLYVQVFQIQAALVQETGVVVKPHDVGDRQVGLVIGMG